MNKPKFFKKILEIDKSYCKNLLEIFDNDYNISDENLYNRDIFFKNVRCNLIIDKFKINDFEKINKFFDISKNLLKKLNDIYGPGRICGFQIASMPGGAIIYPHTDLGLIFAFSHRIHIPLITNQNVIFRLDGRDFYFPSGYAYEINNLVEHSVSNNNCSSFYRKHIIIDYITIEYIHFFDDIVKSNKLNFRYY